MQCTDTKNNITKTGEIVVRKCSYNFSGKNRGWLRNRILREGEGEKGGKGKGEEEGKGEGGMVNRERKKLKKE